MTFKAKTVIPDQFWIVRDNENKVGNIQADGDGYSIRINDSMARFKSLKLLCKQVPITFEPSTAGKTHDSREIYGYPTSQIPYNSVWDVKKQVPLWTKEPRSKSWFAAGWFRMRHHRDWRVTFCPKSILLDRYEYQGPFKSRQEAQKT